MPVPPVVNSRGENLLGAQAHSRLAPPEALGLLKLPTLHRHSEVAIFEHGKHCHALPNGGHQEQPPESHYCQQSPRQF